VLQVGVLVYGGVDSQADSHMMLARPGPRLKKGSSMALRSLSVSCSHSVALAVSPLIFYVC